MNEEITKAPYDEPTTERATINERGLAEPAPQMETESQDMAMDEAMPVSESFGSTRDIKVTPLNSGFLVKVGCQSVAVETNEKLVDMMAKYLADPQGFERKWYSKEVRNRLENI